MPFAISGSLENDTGTIKSGFSLKGSARIAENGAVSVEASALELAAIGPGKHPLTLRTGVLARYDPAARALSLDNIRGDLVVSPAPGSRENAATGETNAEPLRTSFRGKAVFIPAGEKVPSRCMGELHLVALDLDALLERAAPPAPSPDDRGVRGAPNLTRPTVRRGAGDRPHPGFPLAAADQAGAFAGKDAKETTAGTNSSGSRAKGAIPALPLFSPPDCELDVVLDADAVTARSLPLKKTRITLQYKDKQAFLPYEAELFGGNIAGSARLDLRKTGIGATLLGTVKKLDMEEATRGSSGKYRIIGTLDGFLDIAGRGESVTAIIHSLEGAASVQIRNGEIRGFRLIPSDLPHVKKLPTDFPFERMGASAKIKQGVATSKDIALQSALLTGRGGGTAHLAYGQLDIGIDFLLGGHPPAIPVGINGPYNALSCSVDMRSFLRNVAESALQTPGNARQLLRGAGNLLLK
jgi:hypothetical protein